MDYKEFAEKIRTKYPGDYDDLDDLTLARKVIQKYPEYSDVTFGPPRKSDADLLLSGQPRPGHTAQDLAQLATMSGRGLRGLGVGFERLVQNPSDPSQALDAAAQAVSPDYTAKPGEKLGAFAGKALDPVPVALAALGGAPLAAGGMAATMAGGAAAGGGSSIIDQLSEKGDFSGKAAAKDAALSATLAGILHIPTQKIFARLAGAMSGANPADFERIQKDPKLMLPESVGGAESPSTAGQTYRKTLQDAGLDPDKLGFDKYTSSKANKVLFVKQVETDLDRAGEGASVSTKDLIKAHRAAKDVVDTLEGQGLKPTTPELADWIRTKSKIKAAISQRDDNIAQAFNKYSRSMTKSRLSSLLPTGSRYLERRAAMAALSFANPMVGLKLGAAMSPKILSAIATGSALVPPSVKGAVAKSVVDLLRNRRKAVAAQEE